MSTKEYLSYSQIPISDIMLLWHNNYWDGILTGTLLYNEKICHFSDCDENDEKYYDQELDDYVRVDNWYRRFLIYEMTNDQLKKELYWHQLFEIYVGQHTTYDVDGKYYLSGKTRYLHQGIPCALGTRPPELHHNFYEKRKQYYKEIDYSNNKIIGWFER